MDESAEWRMKYDKEFEKNRQLQDELSKVKASLTGTARHLELLQKDNEMWKRQTESLKQQCNCSLPLKTTQD